MKRKIGIDSALTRNLTRRQVIAGGAATAATIAASSAGLMMMPLNALAQATPTKAKAITRLTFDWRTTPVGANIGDAMRDFSSSEITFLSKQFKILALEKGMGAGAYTEAGFLRSAAALKAANPALAVLYYWNAANFSRAIYESAAMVDPSWLIEASPGAFIYNLDVVACRKWWVGEATKILSNANVDGIFIDSLPEARTRFRVSGPALLNELRASLDQLPGAQKIILYNTGGAGQITDSNGNLDPLLQVADGLLFEDFYRTDLTRPRFADKDSMMRVLHGMQIAAANKKIIIFKAWPTFSFMTQSSATPYADLVARARREINFPLAAFLVAAGPYCYLQYSWGWNKSAGSVDHGVFIRTAANATTVDPNWYPELRRALGSPRGAATQSGYVWTRHFAHASVTADLANMLGHITWISKPDYFPRG